MPAIRWTRRATGALQLEAQLEKTEAEFTAQLTRLELSQAAALTRTDTANASMIMSLNQMADRLVALESTIARLSATQATAALATEQLGGSLDNAATQFAVRLDEIKQAVALLESNLGILIAQGATERDRLNESLRQIEQGLDRVEAQGAIFRAIYLGDNRVLIRFRHLPLVFLAQADDRVIVPRMILEGSYEPEVTAFLLREVRPDSFCIDVGANIGYHTCIMAKLAPQGFVLAIEPDPDAFSILRENININWLEAVVRVEPVAAGSSEGEVSLYRTRQRSANTSIAPLDESATRVLGVVPDGSFQAPCRTVDQLAAPLGRNVDFLKIDVEGAEEMVLSGARETVAANPSIRVLMEWSPSQMERAGSSPASLLALIQELGLRVQRFRLDGMLDDISFQDMASSPYWNIVLSRPCSSLKPSGG